MRREFAAAGLAALMLCAAAASPVGTAGATSKPKPMKKTVTMHDNYYSPSKLTITQGSTVTWKWPSDIGDSHDVKTQKIPRGAKFTYLSPTSGKKVTKTKFQSPPDASRGAKFVVTGFTKPGRYHLICTFHETDMQMDITVKK